MRRPHVDWRDLSANVGVTLLLTAYLLVSVHGTARGEDRLILRQADFPSDVGTRSVYAYASAHGKVRGQAVNTVVEKVSLGDLALLKMDVSVNGSALPATWWVIYTNSAQLFQEGSPPGAQLVLPLPRSPVTKDRASARRSEQTSTMLNNEDWCSCQLFFDIGVDGYL